MAAAAPPPPSRPGMDPSSGPARYFPYEAFRPGQEEIIRANAATIAARGVALVESPTGTGKTLNALVPGLEALELNEVDGIVFVTPRKTQHGVVFDDVRRINERGHRFRVLDLVTKGDLCINRDHRLCCTPETCPYLPRRGGQFGLQQFDGRDVINELHRFSRSTLYQDVPSLMELGRRLDHCPHRAAMRLARDAEIVVCDYNYVFSPAIAEIMAEKHELDYGSRLLVVDEGHDLHGRVLAFNSASLGRGFLDAAGTVLAALSERAGGEFIALAEHVRSLYAAAAEECHRACTVDGSDALIEPGALGRPALIAPCAAICSILDGQSFKQGLARALARAPREARERAEGTLSRLGETCSAVARFCESPSFASEFIAVAWRDGDDFQLRLKKLDVSAEVRERIDAFRAAIVQSATLSPLPYYRAVLGLGDGAEARSYPSPFPRENCITLVDATINCSMRFRDLPETVSGVAERLQLAVNTRPGNYLVFFSSYRELGKYEPLLRLPKDTELLVERPTLTQRERDRMVADMKARGAAHRPTVLLGVLGGSFSEGIDLKEEAVIGVVVVGMGIPVPTEENKRMQEHFQTRFGDGFNFVFSYPAIANIMQAKGRLIRTMTDRGVVYLVDNRLLTDRYKALLPPSLREEMISVYNTRALQRTLEGFWREADKGGAEEGGAGQGAAPKHGRGREGGGGAAGRAYIGQRG